MGTLSYGAKELYPLPEAIMDVFSAADGLMVTADLRSAASTDGLAAAGGDAGYADGSGLKDHIKPATWQKALAVAKTLAIKEETLNAQKPWLAALTLRSSVAAANGYDESLAMAKSFTKAAGVAKILLELDPLADQAKVFNALPDNEQEQLLLQVLDELDRQKDPLKPQLEAWSKGDSNSMELLIRQNEDASPVSQKLHEQLVTNRNKAVADKLAEIAANGKVYFVAVDVGRLVGEDGLLAILETKGFQLTQF